MIANPRHPRRGRAAAADALGMKDIHVDCEDGCGAFGIVERVMVAGTTVGEQYDVCNRRLSPLGWSMRRHASGARQLVCPKCTAKRAEQTDTPLPPFTSTGQCPKCNGDEVAIRYMTGREPDSLLRAAREHLARTCKRCTYRWAEACLSDAVASGEKERAGGSSEPDRSGANAGDGDDAARRNGAGAGPGVDESPGRAVDRQI